MITLTKAGQAMAWVAALLLLAVTPSLGAPSKAPSKAAATPPSYINAATVNLRAAPDGDVLQQLDKGLKVFVVKREPGWVKVSIPSLSATGWIAAQFVGSKAPLSVPKAARKAAPAKPPVKPEPKPPAVLAADESDANLGGDLSTEIVLGDLIPAPPSAASLALPVAAFAPDTAWETAAPAANSLTLPEATTQVRSIPAEPDALTAEEELNRLNVLSTIPAAKPGGGVVQESFVPDGQSAVKSKAPAAKPVVVPTKPAGAAPKSATAAPKPALPGPKKLFTGDATTVVTTPLMLEGSFYAVGGRDMGKIDGSDVNLRQKPDTKAKAIGKLQPGDKLYLTSFKKSWYEVSVPGRKLTGWVHSDFVHEFPKVEIKGTQIRLRDEPNTNSEIKDTLDNGEVFYEYERKNGWVKVASSASGVNGWVKGEYLVKSNRSPSRPYTVKGDDVNFRASPEVDADIIARLPRGTKAAVLGRNEKWSYIQVQGRLGWMYSELLIPEGRRGFVVPRSPVGERLIARARAMKGTPYVWGGESDDGVDCSGLIYKVLLDEGVSGKCLPRRASEQMAQLGLEVDKEGLQPGDLVFFSTYKPGPSHVGIYLGDGDFIHASSAQHQVAISNLSESYYKRTFCGARRITEDELHRLQ
jgi:cell wall-associated NlpC family hydrolase